MPELAPHQACDGNSPIPVWATPMAIHHEATLLGDWPQCSMGLMVLFFSAHFLNPWHLGM
jgi:hypothetical protein